MFWTKIVFKNIILFCANVLITFVYYYFVYFTASHITIASHILSRHILSLVPYCLCFPGKQVIGEDIKDELILDENRFNANMLMSLEVESDACYEETSKKKSVSKNSRSHSSSSTSTELVRTNCYTIRNPAGQHLIRNYLIKSFA